MKRILLLLILMGCNQAPDVQTLEQENQRLQKEVDSLSIELQKCNMLLKAYEFDPLTS